MIDRIQILLFMLCLLVVGSFAGAAQAGENVDVQTYSTQKININKKLDLPPSLPPPFIEPAAGTMSAEEEIHIQEVAPDLDALKTLSEKSVSEEIMLEERAPEQIIPEASPLEVILEDTSSEPMSVSVAEEDGQQNHYILGPDDKVKVTVFGERELSGEFKVTSDRTISLPLIGVIDVAGKNLRETEHVIIAELKDGYLKDPNVSVEVIESRPFYIMGEVRAPGSYNYVNGMNILQAVAISGGYTYRANRKKINVLRGTGAPAEPVSVPPEERVKPGDIIFVKERFF